MQQASGAKSTKLPQPPARFMAPAETAERPKNVVSIAEFAQRNQRQRREVS